jgi:maltose alpha-D-glucosyltransferase/alpha-amylase
VFAAAMGRRLAELHAILAQADADPAFRAEPADAAVRRRWADGTVAQLDMAFKLLVGVVQFPDPQTERMAGALLAQADQLRALAYRLAEDAGDALQTRVHGDFHLGQVLVAQGDAYIIDFEGEPARSMDQRREKSSPLRDVAGLLRSFDYATATAREGRGAASGQTSERRMALLEQFRGYAGITFLNAYREVAYAAPRRWVSAEGEAALLDLFLLEKAAYEVRYEVANRPTWLSIPVGGLYGIAKRLLPAMAESA